MTPLPHRFESIMLAETQAEMVLAGEAISWLLCLDTCLTFLIFDDWYLMHAYFRLGVGRDVPVGGSVN